MNTFDLDAMTKILAVEMTARTGEIWRAVITDRFNHIESPSACLSLNEHWQNHRLTIHAAAPPEMKEPRIGETITADPKRTPEAIARDIENRILTHARAHLAESREYDAEQRRQEARRKLRNKMLMKYCPKEYQHEKFCTITGSQSGYIERVYAHPTYDNLINIEINLPLPEALKLLKQLTNGL